MGARLLRRVALARGAGMAAGMAGVHLREVLRNPWTHLAGAVLVGLAVAFRGRGSAVGLVSVVAVLQLYLPPLVVVMAAPLLTRRETWAFWAALPRPPAAAYRGAALGIAGGMLLPLLAGSALAGAVLGLDPRGLALLGLTTVAVTLMFTTLTALFSALTLDVTRAMALGLAAWGLLVLAYGPLVVGVAAAFADYPLDALLVASLIVNPLELWRVGLLHALRVPVLVGPVGKVVTDLFPNGALLIAAASTALGSAVALFAAGWVFWRRER